MNTITNDHIESIIANEHYDYKQDLGMTLCFLTLKNGFIVHGEAHILVYEWYDEKISKERARNNAKDKIWVLEAYLLKQREYDNASAI
jgi:hypothetical protein